MAEPIKTRYERLAAERQPALDRARLCSRLTLPTLIPPDGFNASSNVDTPFQSVGSTGVNSLAAQLLLALMPPNAPFFRFTLDEFRFGELEQTNPTIKAEADAELSKLERRVMQEIEIARIRVVGFECMRHLLVGPSVLMYIPPTGHAKYYPLSKYVIDIDPLGTILEIIVREHVDPHALPTAILEMLKLDQQVAPTMGDKPLDAVQNFSSATPNRKTLELYSVVMLESPGKYKVHQEINGVVLPKSEGTYKSEELPYLHLTYQPVEGSPYGRSLCDDLLGDLMTAEGLSQALVEGSLASARMLNLVKPNAVVRLKDLNEAPNNAYVYGMEGDVTTLKSDKVMDLRVARETLGDVVKRLSTAFLLHTSVQRDAERVTAEEIRYMAQMLEQNLGGVYSNLSQTFQLPLVAIMLGRLKAANLIGKVNDKVIHPVVITGLEALGRGNDLNRLDVFVGQAMQAIGPEAVAARLNVGEYLRRRATALGIEQEGLVYTDEELAAQRRNQMMQQVATDVAPVVAKQAATGPKG